MFSGLVRVKICMVFVVFSLAFCLFGVRTGADVDAAAETAASSGADHAVPLMGIGLGSVAYWTDVWQFVDMMKYSREWRARDNWKDWTIIEDEFGWPVSLESRDGRAAEIDGDHPIFMYMYYRRIVGDVVLTWEGDGEVSLAGDDLRLKEDDLPGQNRRVYTFRKSDKGVFDLVVSRSNPDNHVHNIHLWMPGFEHAGKTFHPLWEKRIEPFAYFRFMDWGDTNNSKQKDWADRTSPRDMRQSRGVAWEYMIQLCNEMHKDMWICIPHLATDDYVRQLARLIKEKLDPGLKVYVEYSNEVWNPSFAQTHWIWEKAKKEGVGKRPWEGGAILYGRRSAQIWRIMARELDNPERLVRVMAHFRFIDLAMGGALDPAYGDGRVDLVALNGYFISQDALKCALRSLDTWDKDRVMDTIEQLHLLGTAMQWQKEIAHVKDRWGLPVTCYEGGQHFANPFSKDLQGEKLAAKIIEVNADPRIREIYRTALETWHLAGGDGFTPFVECGGWSKYGCWGHLRYVDQPIEDVVDPATGKTVEAGAHKYVALLDYLKRWSGRDVENEPRIVTDSLPMAVVGKPYLAELAGQGGVPPYTWSLLGGRLPSGLRVEPEGRIVGTPTQTEQWVAILDCTDSRGQHASKIMGLFMDPADGVEMEVFDFAGGLPDDWRFLKKSGSAEIVMDEQSNAVCVISGNDIPFLPSSATVGTADYTVEALLSPRKKLTPYSRVGLAVCLSPNGDPEDYLRIAIAGAGEKLEIYSRYVKDGRGELWGKRDCPLLPDEGEGKGEAAFDPGEYWTVRATVKPGIAPGAIDLLVGVYDEQGRPRLDAKNRNDVADGMLLLRELPLKDALRNGPFGLLANGVYTKKVRCKRQSGTGQ